MSMGLILRSYAPAIICTILGDIVALFVLVVAGVVRDVVLLVGLILVVCQLAALIVEILRKRPFWHQLTQAMHSGHALMTTEMLDHPMFPEGQITLEALRCVSKAANDEVAAHHRQVAGYREYIETWVHEAKSPLAAAHLSLDNLDDAVSSSMTQNATLVLSKINQIEQELERVEGYIDQALFYARSETLEQDYLIRSYCLKDLVNKALKVNATALIQAHMTPRLEHLDLTVFTDEKWIIFILGQLIQNSVKYAQKDDPTMVFSARLVDEDTAHEAVELEVSDNGCGVSAADITRVFDKGFTGENGRTGKKSTGIGLYLVKRLCEKMGIEVTAISVEGHGFSVLFSFPTNRFRYLDVAS